MIKRMVWYVCDGSAGEFKQHYGYLVVASTVPGYPVATIVPATGQKPAIERNHVRADGGEEDVYLDALEHLDQWHEDCERFVEDL